MTAQAPADLALRPVTAADEAFLARVYASTREAELAGVPFTPEQKAAFLQQQFSAQSRHYRSYVDTTFDVVLVAGEPAGRLIVGHWADREHVADIALLPEFRGGGVGTALLEQVIAVAESRAVPTTVHVERFNRAQRLYARLGFLPAGPGDDAVNLFLERPVGRPGTAGR